MKNLNELASKPTELVDIKKTFGFESDIKIKGFKEKMIGFQKLISIMFLIRLQLLPY